MSACARSELVNHQRLLNWLFVGVYLGIVVFLERSTAARYVPIALNSTCPGECFSYDASPMVSVSMFISVGLAIVAFVIVVMTLIPLA